MSPTNWTGIIAVCTVLGMLGGMLIFGGKILVHFVRMTDAVEKGGQTMSRFGLTLDRVEHGMGEILHKVLDHDNRHTVTNERLDRLEDIVMNADDRAEGTVRTIIGLNPGARKRRNQS